MSEPTRPAGVEVQIREGLTARLLAPQGLAQVAHLVAVGSLLVLLWGVVPAPALFGWAAAVVCTVALRAFVTVRARSHPIDFIQLRRQLRQTVALTGLAWGIGSALLIPSLPFQFAVIILATFGGLVAGGGSTLLADAVAFRLYSLSMLLPATLSMLIRELDRPSLVVAFLTLSVAGFMVRFNTQAYDALREHLETRAELQTALENIRTLGELLPICASCKKIRDDQGYWSQIEEYISEHSEVSFSHGICPDCMTKLYPEFVTGAHPVAGPSGGHGK